MCLLVDVSVYANTELLFCNIDNIHVMRASALSLAEALATQQNMHLSPKVPSSLSLFLSV